MVFWSLFLRRSHSRMIGHEKGIFTVRDETRAMA